MTPDASPRKPALRWALVVLGKVAAFSFLAWLVARDFDRAKFEASLRAVGVLPILACLGLDVAFVLIESVRLSVLCRRAYGLGALVRSRYLSMLVGTALPGLAAGDLVRVFLLDRAKPGNKSGILVLLLGNRLYGLLCLVSLGIFALAQPEGPALLARLRVGAPAVVGVGLLAVTSPLWVQLGPVHRAVEWLLARLPRVAAEPAARAFHALREMTTWRSWLFAVATSTVTNLLVVGQFHTLGRAAGTGLSFAQWCLFVPFIAVATLLPLGLGAVGTQEAALYAVAKLWGIAYEPLLIVSVAMHVVRIGGSLPGLLFFGDLAETVRHLRIQRRTTAAAEGTP